MTKGEGKVCVVTGANSGIGREMTRQLAELGWRVAMVCRNPERGREALSYVKTHAPSAEVELSIADLSLMSEVRRVAAELRAKHPRIDALLNNAGVYLPTRLTTAEGFERMFALNHLAPFLLTHELLPALEAADKARVITTSSDAHRFGHIAFDDLQAERRFGGFRQYGNTKLANVLFTRELARRYGPKGIVAQCFHPGVVRTGFAQDEMALFGWLVRLSGPFMRGAAKAAQIGVFLATSEREPVQRNGMYWSDKRVRRPSTEARNDETALRLWDVSERLVGLPKA